MRNKNAKVSEPNFFVTCRGTDFEPQYSSVVEKDGTVTLKESGKVDIKQMINSQRESTDLAYIIKQIENGNRDVINPGPLFYGDTLQFPKSYAECLQLRIDAEASFYQLPVEVRAQFNNDFNQYFATAGEPDWMKKLGLDDKKEETKEEVSSE